MMKPYHQRRPKLFYVACAALVVAGAYLSFQLGRYEAGYSIMDQHRQQEHYEKVLAAKDATIDDLRRQQAILKTSQAIDQETYGRVKSNLSRLQAKIQSQAEELAFYRGIVSPADGKARLKVTDLEVKSTDAERHYVLRFVLAQAIVGNRHVTGRIRVKLAGSMGKHEAEFDLGQLSDTKSGDDINYAFRYFQSFERELTLPAGFRPSMVEVDIVPDGARDGPITQNFEWSAVSA